MSKIWMLSFECAGLAQAGGLGEAVFGLSKTLALNSGLDVSVFLPSHGRQLDPGIRNGYGFHELTTFIADGHRTGVNGLSYNYLTGLEKGSKDGVNYFLAKGLESATIKRLDDPIIYDHENTFEKMSLFARTMGTYADYLISMGKTGELPDLIHAHDWHMVPAGVLVKQRFWERGVNIPLVFTVHLLSRITLPWHYASENWSGIKDASYALQNNAKGISTLKYSQLWEDVCHNSLERVGCYTADYVTSVSHSYLIKDVQSYVGSAILGKSGHIYNGCDWDPDNIGSAIAQRDLAKIELTLGGGPWKRWDLRKHLLTKAISKIEAKSQIEVTAESDKTSRRNEDGAMEPFQNDGPLVLMTGRLSPQKGVDVLLDAVPLVLRSIPEAKFLLFLLSSNDSDLTALTVEKAAKYPDNVRLILGRHPTIYFLSHIAADVYAMPSRSEPFGISALEAMVTGNPVVGARVGGITETVLDISTSGDLGTGILIPPEDVAKLAGSLVSLLAVMQLDEHVQRGNENGTAESGKTPLKSIERILFKNPSLGSKLRENCRNRVISEFRWSNAGQMALGRYSAAKLLATKTFNSVAKKEKMSSLRLRT